MIAAGVPRDDRPRRRRCRRRTIARDRGIDAVVLTGGVFQNVRLTEIVERDLRRAGLTVLVHERVPPNDGGISIGQAAIAAH